jgi:RimJ/RimL family protein N-acetyltransferase
MKIELQDISLDDLELYEALRCDPEMMTALGGPQARAYMPEKLRRDVESVENGECWISKVIVGGDPDQVAGSVCIWPNTWRGEPISEVGWMILTSFQGRGIATEAVAALRQRARAELRWGVVHAFPATDNGPSNAICQKLGFSWIEECDLDWGEHKLASNHWQLRLF